jgi:hypothetical protein
MSEEHRNMENKVWARIAKTRGIDINKLIGEEYKPLKEVAKDEHRQQFLDNLNNFFDDDSLDN